MSRTERPAFDDSDRALLLDALPAASLPPARAQLLLDRILQAVTAQTTEKPDFEIVRADKDDWRPLLPGLAIKPLRIDVAGRSQTSLWRLGPGAAIPAHGHRFEEECLVVEGDLMWGGERYGRGDYLVAHPGGHHDEFISPSGAVLLIRSELTEPLRRLFAV